MRGCQEYEFRFGRLACMCEVFSKDVLCHDKVTSGELGHRGRTRTSRRGRHLFKWRVRSHTGAAEHRGRKTAHIAGVHIVQMLHFVVRKGRRRKVGLWCHPVWRGVDSWRGNVEGWAVNPRYLLAEEIRSPRVSWVFSSCWLKERNDQAKETGVRGTSPLGSSEKSRRLKSEVGWSVRVEEKGAPGMFRLGAEDQGFGAPTVILPRLTTLSRLSTSIHHYIHDSWPHGTSPASVLGNEPGMSPTQPEE
jgi:hypothetical protein